MVEATETIQPLADNVSHPVADNMAEKCIAAATAQVLDEGALLKGRVPHVQDFFPQASSTGWQKVEVDSRKCAEGS